MISHKHKCIFIHVPKTAGESIETALMGHPNWEKDDPQWKTLNLPPDSEVGDDKHYRLHKWASNPFFEEYFKFSFVRNPWDAAVSLYHYDKKRRNFPHSFKEWITGINPALWKRFLNQLSFITLNGKVGVDFVGRYESLERDWAYISGRLGIPYSPLPHANPSSSRKHYTEYYDDFSREFIREKCSADIDFFGYAFGDVKVSPSLRGVDKAFWINLERRADRAEHIKTSLPFEASRFAAIDGRSLSLGETSKLFSNPCLSRSEMACALSHYGLWKKLVYDSEATSYLVLEDDVVFKENFVEEWNAGASEGIPSDFFLIYLGGCQPWNQPRYSEVLEPYNKHFNRVKKNDFFIKDDYFWHMNASSYIISKECASLLCQYVESSGFDRALDHFLIHFVNKNKLFSTPHRLYHLNPLYASQKHEEGGNTEIPADSDIQKRRTLVSPSSSEGLTLIWQFDPEDITKCYEKDWIRELFSEVKITEVVDGRFQRVMDNSLIIYNDIHKADISNEYTDALYAYLEKAKKSTNCSIMHLGDEFTHARTEHYKDFVHVIRTTFNKSVAHLPNILQIPLGYKQGFHK